MIRSVGDMYPQYTMFEYTQKNHEETNASEYLESLREMLENDP